MADLRPNRSGQRGRLFGLLAPTIRLRLTILYGIVFLISGAALLTIGYLLVRNNLDTHQTLRTELRRLGLHPASSFPPGSPEAVAIHGVEQQIRDQALHRLLFEYIIALVAMTGISVATGWLLAGRALSPLREITATARRVSAENLGERIALKAPADELKELADTFDGMLERLDGTFASQRHFVANASHELRTPLAIMRTEVDVALADPDADVDELRSMGEAVRETVDRCEHLIASLLLLARSEAAAGRGEAVDIAALAGDCITDLRAGAKEAGVRISGELEPAWAMGDPSLLERMIANLLDNGIHHNEPGGYLVVRTEAQGASVVLTVTNGGPRIDPTKVQTLADPFRRLDRSVAGFGLGLSIVRSVAEAHGGTATLAAPATGGLEVVVTLPRLPTPAAARPRARETQRAFSGDPQARLTGS
ncbi:MAG: HAMP domain-containing sensor histidine kinase [Solirubrobacteraceae bacterium]